MTPTLSCGSSAATSVLPVSLIALRWRGAMKPAAPTRAKRCGREGVGEDSARKDYDDGPARCARSGTGELWVFDPLRLGPRDGGGPGALRVWPPLRGTQFPTVYAGDGPPVSRALRALVGCRTGQRAKVWGDR